MMAKGGCQYKIHHSKALFKGKCDLTSRIQRKRPYPFPSHPLRQSNGKQHIRRLALRVRHKRVIRPRNPIRLRAHDPKDLQPLQDRALLLRQVSSRFLKIHIVIPDWRGKVRVTRYVDNPRTASPSLRRS